VAPYEFLSPEWITAAKGIRDEYRGRVPPPPHPVRMNLEVTESPFDGEVVRAFVDTSDGELILEEGVLDPADLTVTIDYATARAIFVDQDQQAAMQAFLGGRIKVQGDMSRLLALQSTSPEPGAAELAAEISARVKEITAH